MFPQIFANEALMSADVSFLWHTMVLDIGRVTITREDKTQTASKSLTTSHSGASFMENTAIVTCLVIHRTVSRALKDSELE